MRNNAGNISLWTPYTTVISAISSNPTPGSGYVLTSYYMQIGKVLNIQVYFNQSNAGTAGSGMYLYSMPPGFSINTAIAPVFSGSVGYSTLGNYIALYPSQPPNVGSAMCYDATHYVIYGFDAYGDEEFISSTSYGLNTSPLNFSLTLFVPIL